MYEVLTGGLPFGAHYWKPELAAQYAPPSGLVPSFPAGLDEVIGSMLEADFTKRPKTGADLVKLLKSV